MPETKETSKKNALRAVTRQSVSPLQRYRMIAEVAYYRALKRGFLSGNPVEDWLEAEKGIDAKYAVDLGKLLVTPHIAGLLEPLNRLLRDHGLPPIDVKTLVENERKNVEALAFANARMGQPIKTAVSRQIQILTDALEGMLARFELLAKASGARGAFAAEHGKLVRLLGERTLANLRESMDATMQASVENLDILKARVVESLGVLKSLAEGFAEQSPPSPVAPSPDTSESLDFKQALAPPYAGKPFRELITAPVSAFLGLSESDAQVLQDTFGIRTLKDFAESRHFNWALQILRMVEAEGQ
jgi:hypothetical protein